MNDFSLTEHIPTIVALFAQHGYKRLEKVPYSAPSTLMFVKDYAPKRQKVIVLYQPRGLAGMPPASEKQLLEQLSVAIPGAEKQMEAAERATKRRSRLWRGR